MFRVTQLASGGARISAWKFAPEFILGDRFREENRAAQHQEWGQDSLRVLGIAKWEQNRVAGRRRGSIGLGGR